MTSRSVPSSVINRTRKAELQALHGASSQLVRLEWITATGGTLNIAHGVNAGETKTLQVNDVVPAIYGAPGFRSKDDLDAADRIVSIDEEVTWYFANDFKFGNLAELVIIQKLKSDYLQSDGTGTGAVWTPDSAPAWVVDSLIGYDLVFSDRRFKIISNTALKVTVDLPSLPLPNALPGAAQFEIYESIEWFPIRDDPQARGASLAPLGDQLILQGVACSRIQRAGRA